MLTSAQDAYGHLIFAHHQGYPVTEIVERDDGWIGTSEGAAAYFAPHAQWPLTSVVRSGPPRGGCWTWAAGRDG